MVAIGTANYFLNGFKYHSMGESAKSDTSHGGKTKAVSPPPTPSEQWMGGGGGKGAGTGVTV